MALPPLYDGAPPAVSAQIRAYCGWHVAPEMTETLTVNGSGTQVVYLPTLHASSVAPVKLDGETLDPDQYEWSQDGVLRRAGHQRWPDRLRCLEVTLVHGYGDRGDELKAAADALAQFWAIAGMGSVRVGQVQIGGGGGDVAIPAHVAAMLDRYAL